MKSYKGDILPGVWELYIKVDGVNLFCKDNKALTRDGNLYELPFHIEKHGHYELFIEDWGSSISLLSRLEECKKDNLYDLDRRDKRLFLSYIQNPSKDMMEEQLSYVVSQGHEGLVLKQGKKELKVKPFTTSDVRVTGIKPGTGRNKGKVGSLVTPYGNILLQKDEDKQKYRDGSIIGKIVEVRSFGWTNDMKLRHGRFLRERPDKDEEHLETIDIKYRLGN